MHKNPYHAADTSPKPTTGNLDSSEGRVHHIDAVHFVLHAIKHALWDSELATGGTISAEALCRVLMELAVDEFGGEGKTILLGWNVESSDDIGLIVARMREAEVSLANRVHPETEFHGLFDLNEPPEMWKLKW